MTDTEALIERARAWLAEGRYVSGEERELIRQLAVALAAEKERADVEARDERFGRNLRLWRDRAVRAEAQVAAEKERADEAEVHVQRLANELLAAVTGKVDAEAQVTALRRALSEHHAIGAMAGRRVGDLCPICKRMGVTDLLRSVPG